MEEGRGGEGENWEGEEGENWERGEGKRGRRGKIFPLPSVTSVTESVAELTSLKLQLFLKLA